MDTAPSPYYRLAEEFALHTGRSIYLTGKAGTGKTTFLRRLRSITRKQTAVVAPTGVAAINAGGVTMHSFFQLPFGPFVPTPAGRNQLIGQLHMQAGRRKVLQQLELLVIDEVSMVRADTLDMVDTILRHVRFRPDEPFGGVQVVFIGDLYQLSPVVSDEEWRILAPYYPTPYFFHSQAVRQRPPVHIELDRIFRQADGRFIRLLNEVRDNRLTPEGLDLLRSRYDPAFTPPEGDTYVTLTTHNYKADRINQAELAKLPGPAASFRAEVKGEYPEKSYPAEATLELKTGAKVMFLKNDTETPRRYFNGKIGVVEEMDDDGITVRCPGDDAPILVQRDTWRNIRYTTDPATRQIEEKELGTFTQYPLRLAWAITIHKSQGLTFDKAVIDAGDAFAPGQVYVALSRCRSLEGLVLHSPVSPQSLHNDQAIVEHERQRPAISQLEAQLEQSKNEYRLELLNTLFELGGLEGHAARLQRLVAGHTTFSPGASAYADALTDEVRPLRDIGARFRTQLHAILARTPVDEAYLQARIAAAADFFCGKLDTLADTLRRSDVTTDSRDQAGEYEEEMEALFTEAAQKRHLLAGLKARFTVEDYYRCRNDFSMPPFALHAYAGHDQAKPRAASRHPGLYQALVRRRRELCEPDGTPIYLVAQTRTLLEMADYLPQTEDELLRISGFGPAKVKAYGTAFLEVIHDYCLEHGLGSLMHEKEDKKPKRERKPKAEKPPKVPTRQRTLELYQQGKTPDEIAAERGLAVSTIVGHLAPHLGNEVDIDDLIAPARRELALRLAREQEEAGQPPYAALKAQLSPVEYHAFLAWRKRTPPPTP